MARLFWWTALVIVALVWTAFLYAQPKPPAPPPAAATKADVDRLRDELASVLAALERVVGKTADPAPVPPPVVPVQPAPVDKVAWFLNALTTNLPALLALIAAVGAFVQGLRNGKKVDEVAERVRVGNAEVLRGNAQISDLHRDALGGK